MENIKKNYSYLSSTEKQNYIEAVKAVKASINRNTNRSIYDEYVLWHTLAAAHEDPSVPRHFRNAAHVGPAFLPWHRYYLYRFERQLQRRYKSSLQEISAPARVWLSGIEPMIISLFM